MALSSSAAFEAESGSLAAGELGGAGASPVSVIRSPELVGVES
jgi:hypothetical protein